MSRSSLIVFIVAAACVVAQVINSYFNPTMQVNPAFDAIPKGPYKVGYKISSHYDPTGQGSTERFSWFGQLFPILNKFHGRNTGYDEYYPVDADAPCHPLQTFWNTHTSIWASVNYTANTLCHNAPLTGDPLQGVLMGSNGFGNGANEYAAWAIKLASYGYYVKFVQFHWLDYVTSFLDRATIFMNRFLDLTNGLDDLLEELDDTPSNIGCIGHSFGAVACADLNVGYFSGRRDLRFNFLVLLDPSMYVMPYEAYTSTLDIPILGLYSESALWSQDLVPLRNGNRNPIHYPIYFPATAHSQFHPASCQQSLVALATGQFNNIPSGANGGWAFPGHMATHWCTLTGFWFENPISLTPEQHLFNTGMYWILSFVKAYVNRDPNQAAVYQKNFKLQKVEAFQNTMDPNVYAPFVFLSSYRLGNLTWSCDPTQVDICTALELLRHPGANDYALSSHFFGSNGLYASYASYIEDPHNSFRCTAPCPYFGVTGINVHGFPYVNITQPRATDIAAISGSGCYQNPAAC